MFPDRNWRIREAGVRVADLPGIIRDAVAATAVEIGNYVATGCPNGTQRFGYSLRIASLRDENAALDGPVTATIPIQFALTDQEYQAVPG